MTSNKKIDSFLSEDNKNSNNANIERLRKKLIAENAPDECALLLGAGVSQSVGLPSWSKLLYQLFGIYYANTKFDSISDSSALRNKIIDLQNGKIELYHTDTLVFADALKPQLNDNLDIMHLPIKKIFSKDVDNNILKYDFNKDKTFYKVAKLINNNHLNQILTYNYDNCLEYFLNDKLDSGKEISVINLTKEEFDICKPAEDKLQFIHLHGYMDVFNLFPDKEAAKIIFTESSYSDIETNIYNIINITQVNFLMSKTVLFIGVSADDLNLKRILRILKNDNVKNQQQKSDVKEHYIIFNADDYIKKICNNKLDDIVKNKSIYEVDIDIFNKHIQIINNYWCSRNINPIWCTLDDIPKVIDYLSK